MRGGEQLTWCLNRELAGIQLYCQPSAQHRQCFGLADIQQQVRHALQCSIKLCVASSKLVMLLGTSCLCICGLVTISSDNSTTYNGMLMVENTEEGRRYQFHFSVLHVLPQANSITGSDYWDQYFPAYRLQTLGIVSVSSQYMRYRCCIFIQFH